MVCHFFQRSTLICKRVFIICALITKYYSHEICLGGIILIIIINTGLEIVLHLLKYTFCRFVIVCCERLLCCWPGCCCVIRFNTCMLEIASGLCKRSCCGSQRSSWIIRSQLETTIIKLSQTYSNIFSSFHFS